MPDGSSADQAPQGAAAGSERKGSLFPLYVALAILLVWAGYFFRTDLKAALLQLEAVVGILGPAAPVAMAVICGAWGALCLPGPLMQGTVGTLFSAEPLTALGVVVVGETMGQAIAFALARTLGRRRVRQRLAGKPWFARLEQETASRGSYGVFFFRLMPFFPNALGSYAFGLTGIGFWSYLGASVVGSFPKMVLYIFGTTSVARLFRSGAVSPVVLLSIFLTILAAGLAGRSWQLRLRRRTAVKS